MPPSVAFIVFGVIANVSIGKLFMATIFPEDSLNARLMKVKPTGNGRRESYAHVRCRMHEAHWRDN